jgi:hypothetical protein
LIPFKNNILKKIGRYGMVFCNQNSNYIPVLEYIDSDAGSITYYELDNDPKEVPALVQKWKITFSKNRNIRAVSSCLNSVRISSSQLIKVLIDLEKLFPPQASFGKMNQAID